MNLTISRLVAGAALAVAAALPAQAAFLNHHFTFQAGVVDQVNASVAGTLFGNANVAGGALNLDGSGDYVEFATALVPNAGSYSIALFAWGNGLQAGYTEMISQGFSGGPGFYLGTDGGGQFMRATDSWGATGVPFGAPNAWNHYALVVDASGPGLTSLYVNGALAATVPYAIATNPGGTPTRFGAQFGPYGEFFNGAIDDVRIYDGVLTGAEVAALANPVPEPATALSLLAGLSALVVMRRRRPQ